MLGVCYTWVCLGCTDYSRHSEVASFFMNQSCLISILTDLLTLEHHTPTPEPVKYDKKDGQWYTHNGVDVKDTQQRKGGNHSVKFC